MSDPLGVALRALETAIVGCRRCQGRGTVVGTLGVIACRECSLLREIRDLVIEARADRVVPTPEPPLEPVDITSAPSLEVASEPPLEPPLEPPAEPPVDPPLEPRRPRRVRRHLPPQEGLAVG